MASKLTSDGSTIRIEVRRPGWAALSAFPLFCGAFYMFVAAGMGLMEMAATQDQGIGPYLTTPLLFLFGLALCVLGMAVACNRFLVIRKSRGDVRLLFKIGPLQWYRRRKLSDFNLVKVDWEPDRGEGSGTYFVTLAGREGTDAMRVASFDTLQPANGLARELASALNLQIQDAPQRRRQQTGRS